VDHDVDAGPDALATGKVRHRSATFADHFSQARLFYRSQLPIEQAHIASALVFELSKVKLEHVRNRVLANLQNVDLELAARVALGLGTKLPIPSQPAAEPIDLPLAPSLSIIRRVTPTLVGRSVGVLFADDSPRADVLRLKGEIEDAGGRAVLIAPKLRVTTKGGALDAEAQLAGTPSVTLDAIALVLTSKAATDLCADAAAVQFVMDAYGHLKAIGHTPGAQPLLDRAGAVPGDGITGLNDAFVKAAGQRFFDRESTVRALA
jgi:catalase